MATEISRSSRKLFRVRYSDLGGGRNTRKDSHALNRDQLAISINTWMFAAHSLSKRPGNTPAITTSGATGSGATIKSMQVARFADTSVILAHTGSSVYAGVVGTSSYANVGSVDPTAKAIQVAQMWDTVTNDTTAFIVDGVDKPQTYLGFGSMAPVGTVPLNHAGTGPITPKYVSTLMNSLWYAGEPTEPTGVYISDPTAPESFTYGGQLPGASYIPYLVGYNDGVAGGSITQIMPLGNAMIVFKQSAIYAFVYTGYYGDVGPWAVQLISASVGTTSPRSVVSFDTFLVFLGIDGVYTVDLNNGVSRRPISDNNPDLFDGPLSAILDRTSAVGVRYGGKYLLWYDNGGAFGSPGIPNPLPPLGYPSAGVWFDFVNKDEDGLPCVGEIRGMPVSGVAPLRGPADTGNFAWGSGAADKTGVFGGISGDFGQTITTVFAGKSDFFDKELGDSGPEDVKTVEDVAISVSLLNPQPNEQLTFLVSLTADLYSSLESFAQSEFGSFQPGAQSTVGTAVVGTAIVGVSSAAQAFQVVRAYAQNNVRGHVIQTAFQESSVFPWTTLGYSISVSSKEAIRP